MSHLWAVPTAIEPVVPPGVCPHCRKDPLTDPSPWAMAQGRGCTYGYDHDVFHPAPVKVAAPRKADAKLCTKCGLHSKNPASATNGCEHIYPA